MNIKEIKELIEIINKSNLTGFEYENAGVKIVLRKEVQVVAGAPAVAAVHHNTQAVPQHEVPETTAAVNEKDTVDITSPIVGTFYAASSPSAPSFANVGDKVKKGQVLCIVEAMKLMNEITADFDCEVVKVLVKNEEVVQYGQPLFLVKAV